jgi:hypothetical protein
MQVLKRGLGDEDVMAIITSLRNKSSFLHAKRSGHLFYFYTIRRLILIAKQGLTGSRTEYKSSTYKAL